MEMIISAIEAMDPVLLGGAVLATTAIFAAAAACGLIRYLMAAIGYSKMYRKAGVAGWKAFIPVYRNYNNYKIAWTGKMFFVFAVLYILFGATSESTGIALQLICAAAGIALIVVDVKQNIKMAKCFGKGAGTGILLFLFPGITSLVLGLGKAEFVAVAE